MQYLVVCLTCQVGPRGHSSAHAVSVQVRDGASPVAKGQANGRKTSRRV